MVIERGSVEKITPRSFIVETGTRGLELIE